MMLYPADLHDYQKRAVNWQCAMPKSMLWLDMGLGKTAITLTSVAHLLNAKFLRGVLIVAPIRVVRLVWRQEARKWQHLGHLTFSSVTGTPDQRVRALLRPADIYLTNYENLKWIAETLQTYFVKKNRPLPFNGIVWDEVSKMKNSSTKRVGAFNKINDQFAWATGLTGTPVSNGYKDLHGQYLVVDNGERLGTSKTAFRTRFYKKQGPYKEVPYDDTEEIIKGLIGDITLEMSAAEYNPLPDLIVNDIEVELNSKLRTMYEQLEKELFLTLDSGTDIELFNKSSLMNKCVAEGTEVLTYDGWKRIETITNTDFVWDGVEWVSISSVVYNGYMPVVGCWGVDMTPDHKVLTTDGWKFAQEVLDGQPGKRFDRAPVRTPFSACERGEQGNRWDIGASVVESSVRLWDGTGVTGYQLKTTGQTETEILRMSSRRDNCETRNDQNSSVDDLAKYEVSLHEPLRQGLAKLRGAWDQSVRRVGVIIRCVLGRHEKRVFASSNHRTNRRGQGVRQDELYMGNKKRAGEQYSEERHNQYTEGANDSRSSGGTVQNQTHHVIPSSRERVDGSKPRFARVYDILNAGPRHRFTVRGKDGQVFIAHNCLQFSNGAVYPVPGMPLWEAVHELKLDALEEILDEANGSPVLCSYAYRSDAERIMERFKDLDPINLTECKSEGALNNAMLRWATNDCPLMIGHPLSMGHGIDGLQRTGHTIVWFGLNWSLDLYDQFNARLRRQGQGAPVICHRILIRNTIDQVQAVVLNDKTTTQNGLRSAIRQYRKEKGELHV